MPGEAFDNSESSIQNESPLRSPIASLLIILLLSLSSLLAEPLLGVNAVAQLAPATNMSATATPTAKERWDAAVDVKNRTNPSFAFVEPNPALPDVLIIGDSISIGYTPVVRKLLEGKANVYRIPENAAWSSNILKKTQSWFDVIGKQHFKVIVVNSGIHDLTRLVDKKYDVKGDNHIPLPQYKVNVEKIIQLLKPHADTILWASTTPLPSDAAPGRLPGDEITYNKTAVEVMQRLVVPVIDLYAIALMPPSISRPKDVHFNDAGYDRLGSEVVKQVSLKL